MPDSTYIPTRTKIHGFELEFLPQCGLYWPSTRTLFVADTHFGKDATFRSSGIPVPQGGTADTLTSLSQMLIETKANRLILLGDMFHARSSLAPAVRDLLSDFFNAHSAIQFSLVLGNHDRNIGKLPNDWSIEVLEADDCIDGIQVAHHPTESELKCELRLCGHVHPSYRVSTVVESAGKLPCFWLSGRQLILPAIGRFTGTHAVRPRPQDRLWVITPSQVMEIPIPQNGFNKKNSGSL